MSFPDPEMRKFLANGTVEGVRAALSPHIAEGLEVSFVDYGNGFELRYSGKEYSAATSQMLKHTVAAANALFQGEQ